MRIVSTTAFCTEVPAFYLVEALHVLSDVLSTCWETCADNEACACEWTECFGCNLTVLERDAVDLLRRGGGR